MANAVLVSPYLKSICVLFCLLVSWPVLAQDQTATVPSDPDFAPLNPDAPLDDLPDMEVEWPDLSAPSTGAADDTVDVFADFEERYGFADDGSSEVEQGDVDQDAAQVQAEVAEEGLTDRADTAQDSMEAQRYRVVVTGWPDNAAIAGRFAELSVLESTEKSDANFAQIKRRSESDRDLIERLMRIAGYYDAVVRYNIDASPGQSGLTVNFRILPGAPFVFAKIDLPGAEQLQDPDRPIVLQSLGLSVGDLIDSDRIILGSAAMHTAMLENGYAFAKVDEPELTVDFEKYAGDLLLPVDPGGRYVFGQVRMNDVRLFGAKHVQSLARFDPGDVYRLSDVEDLRRALIATGIVSTVSVTPVPTGDGEIADLAVDVTPARLRTISGELGYGTGEGIKATATWEHRNLFPPEGLLRVSALAGTQEQAGSVTFRRNNFRKRDQVLNASLVFANIDRSAFEARTATLSANIERLSNINYQKRWTWSAGVEALWSQERDAVGLIRTDDRESFRIAGLNGFIGYDASDDLLNPSKGFRLSARLSPEYSWSDGGHGYVKAQVDGSFYQPAGERLVLAARGRLATIAGSDTVDIAPSRRLYSGGGGSVRGYGFQRIGPRDVNNDPVGGRSLAEFSLEARVRFGNFGVVPFVDAGNVYDSSTPDFSEFRIGAGIGLRYYSSFGPIRIDVGTPINPQTGDSRIAIAVSLGQAF